MNGRQWQEEGESRKKVKLGTLKFKRAFTRFVRASELD